MSENMQHPSPPSDDGSAGSEYHREATTVTGPARRASILSRNTWTRRPILAGSAGALGVVVALGALSGFVDDDENRETPESLVLAVSTGGSGFDDASLENLLDEIDLSDADLDDVELSVIDLSEVDLGDVDLGGTGIDGADAQSDRNDPGADDGEELDQADEDESAPVPDAPSSGLTLPGEGNTP